VEHVNNYQFASGVSGLGDWNSGWIPVAAAGYRRASFTLGWAGVAATAGTLAIEGTDDPTQTIAVALTLGTYHGTYPTVGAGAGTLLAVVDNCPGWVRLKYTRSGGGAAAQFNGHVTRS
jgi:hypothetical protein